jgi:anti-anti-sigma factor
VNFRSALDLELEESPRAVQVRMAGSLCYVTMESASKLLELAERHSAPGVIVDLTGVDFVDSQGLRLLLGYWRSITEQGRRFVVVRPRPPVDIVFKITLVDERIELVDDLPAALARVERG